MNTTMRRFVARFSGIPTPSVPIFATSGRVSANALADIIAGSRPARSNASFGVTAAQALKTGEVDGFWANAMGAETALRSGVGSLVLDVRRGIEPSRERHYTFSSLIGRDDTIRDKPEFVKSAISAVVRAQQALCELPELARKIGDSLFPPRPGRNDYRYHPSRRRVL